MRKLTYLVQRFVHLIAHFLFLRQSFGKIQFLDFFIVSFNIKMDLGKLRVFNVQIGHKII